MPLAVAHLFKSIMSYWILHGCIEMIYYVANGVMFSIWTFKFIPDSIVYLEVITSYVIVLTALLFIFTFNSGISTFSVPVISAVGVHFLLVFILLYYTIDGINRLNSMHYTVMIFKFAWFVYEFVFVVMLIRYWKNRVEEFDRSRVLRRQNI